MLRVLHASCVRGKRRCSPTTHFSRRRHVFLTHDTTPFCGSCLTACGLRLLPPGCTAVLVEYAGDVSQCTTYTYIEDNFSEVILFSRGYMSQARMVCTTTWVCLCRQPRPSAREA